MDERLWYLKNSELFERLDEAVIARLEREARYRKIARGGVVYMPQEAADSVYLVLTGRVKLFHITPEGKQAVLALIDAGELFGELALLDGTPREEYAEAMESSSLLRLPREIVRDLMASQPDLALGVTRLVGLRRRRIERRLKSLLFRSNRDRLVGLLLELAEKYGKRRADGVELGVRLSHQDLASIIGSTRETVTVVLNELRNEGSLTIERRRVILKQVASLARSVDVAVPEIAPAPSPRAESPRPAGQPP
ncbi:MAG: Crp/Fnr family transcriptional regulator [Planctomycetaceae bacterium]